MERSYSRRALFDSRCCYGLGGGSKNGGGDVCHGLAGVDDRRAEGPVEALIALVLEGRR